MDVEHVLAATSPHVHDLKTQIRVSSSVGKEGIRESKSHLAIAKHTISFMLAQIDKSNDVEIKSSSYSGLRRPFLLLVLPLAMLLRRRRKEIET
jgi:hypothetical protein